MTDPTDLAQTASPLAAMKATLRIPGSRLGYLPRAIESAAKKLGVSLHEHGRAVLVSEVLGHKTEVPVEASIDITLRVKVGSGEPQAWTVRVEPQPRPAKTAQDEEDTSGVDADRDPSVLAEQE